jgi:MmgE/PrpD N-terminal domain
MHNPAADSAVTEALVKFALAPLIDRRVLSAASHAVSQARERVAAAGDAGQRVAALLRSQGSTSEDTRVRAWVLGAVLATHTESPATAVLATAIHMGDKLAASDEQIGGAAAVGMEASARLLAAVDSEEFRWRWNVSSALGVLGATLSVARLLQLDEARTRHALGIAATQTAGLARNASSSMAAIETGKAAADAIEAALLAKHGFTSAAAAIDGRRGFAALLAYRFDATCITEGLGVNWISLD